MGADSNEASVQSVVLRPLSWKVYTIRGSVFGVATDQGTCVGVGLSPSSAISQAVVVAQLRGVAVDFVDGGEASDGFVQLMATWFHSYKGKLPPNEYKRLDFVFGAGFARWRFDGFQNSVDGCQNLLGTTNDSDYRVAKGKL